MKVVSLIPTKIGIHARIIFLIILVLFPAIVVLILQGRDLYKEKVSSVFAYSAKLALRIASHPKDIAPDPDHFLDHLTQLHEVHTPEECDELLLIIKPILLMHPYFNTVAVADKAGNRICPNSSVGTSTYVGDRNYFKDLHNTKSLTISGLLVGRVSGRKSIVFAKPILDKSANINKVLLLGLSTEWLSQSLKEAVAQAQLPQGAVAVIIDSDGVIIAAEPAFKGQIGNQIPDWQKVKPLLLQSRDLAREEIWRDGMHRATTYLPIFDSSSGSVILRVGVPIGPALKGVTRDTIYRLISILVVVLITLLFAWLTGKRLLLEPIRAIWKAANSLKLGDFSARVGDVKATGELGELASAFDSMAKQVQEDRQRLHFLAMHDPLTGLPNRYWLREHLAQIIVQAKKSQTSICVMLLDLDGFKEINDGLGHPLGDKVLIQVAQRLSALAPYTTAARLGGDEFVLVVEEGHSDLTFEAMAIVLRETIRKPVLVDEHQFFISVSVGLATIPDHGDDVDAILQNADVAMYCAKNEKVTGFCFYSPILNEFGSAKIRMQTLLSQAVAREELVLYYQPKVNAASGKVVGAEALIRWNSRELGIVPPTEFIPLAEKTGVIIEIGEWVLETACRQLRSWCDEVQSFPKAFSMSVNLSPRQFNDENLVEKISRMLERSGVSATQLELEITEGTLMHNPVEAISALNCLRSLGMKVSVDDFGTGYSSLGYLKELPIDALKIDRSFVSNLPNDSRDYTIVGAIITISKDLGLRVTAEGVETEQHLRVLKTLGCDEFQGYLFSKPVPAEDFIGLLRKPNLLAF